MSPRGFLTGLTRILVPTPLQALASLLLSFVLLALIEYQQVFGLFGLHISGADTGKYQVFQSFNNFISLPALSNTTIITTGAYVVLAVYLFIWAAYKALTTTQTQVSYETGVADSTGWLILLRELGIKIVIGLIFVQYVANFSCKYF